MKNSQEELLENTIIATIKTERERILALPSMQEEREEYSGKDIDTNAQARNALRKQIKKELCQ